MQAFKFKKRPLGKNYLNWLDCLFADIRGEIGQAYNLILVDADSFKIDENEIFHTSIILENGKEYFLPPACEWISYSGRFVSLDLGLLGCNQLWVLFDVFNKQFASVGFHDLISIDEDECIVYGRTLTDIQPYEVYGAIKLDLSDLNNFSKWSTSLENKGFSNMLPKDDLSNSGESSIPSMPLDYNLLDKLELLVKHKNSGNIDLYNLLENTKLISYLNSSERNWDINEIDDMPF